MDQNQEILQQLQNQINTLQQQLAQANQAYMNLSATVGSSSAHSLQAGKPDKFRGQNARSWVKSIENVFKVSLHLCLKSRKLSMPSVT